MSCSRSAPDAALRAPRSSTSLDPMEHPSPIFSAGASPPLPLDAFSSSPFSRFSTGRVVSAAPSAAPVAPTTQTVFIPAARSNNLLTAEQIRDDQVGQGSIASRSSSSSPTSAPEEGKQPCPTMESAMKVRSNAASSPETRHTPSAISAPPSLLTLNQPFTISHKDAMTASSIEQVLVYSLPTLLTSPPTLSRKTSESNINSNHQQQQQEHADEVMKYQHDEASHQHEEEEAQRQAEREKEQGDSNVLTPLQNPYHAASIKPEVSPYPSNATGDLLSSSNHMSEAASGSTAAAAAMRTPPSKPPIDNHARFIQLVLGIVVMMISSIAGTFAIFGFFIQQFYGFPLVEMVDIFAVGTATGMISTFFFGALYDLHAHRITMGLSMIIVFVACLCFGLTFDMFIFGTYTKFMLFFVLLNAGTYTLDMVAIITTATHLPRNRGMVCGLLQTINGLGSSLYSCLYRGYLYNKYAPKQYSNLFYLLTAVTFVLGIVCMIWFDSAPWADIPFYAHMRHWRSHGYTSSQYTSEEIEAKLERYFLLKVPFLKYRLPPRRVRIVFTILFCMNLFFTTQLICVTFMHVTSLVSLNVIATIGLILLASLTVFVWPWAWLDKNVDYVQDEQDMDEDGCIIPRNADNQTHMLCSTGQTQASPSARENEIGQSATRKSLTETHAPQTPLLPPLAPQKDASHSPGRNLPDMSLSTPYPGMIAHVHRELPPPLQTNNSLSHTNHPSFHLGNSVNLGTPVNKAPTTAPFLSSPMASSGNLTQLLFARNVSVAVASCNNNNNAHGGGGGGGLLEVSQPPVYIGRTRISPSAREGGGGHNEHGNDDALSPTLRNMMWSPPQSPNHQERDGNGSHAINYSTSHHNLGAEGEGEEVEHILQALSDPPESKRIPINYDSIAELLKHRSGFFSAMLTMEMLSLLWMSFTVWSTGLIITSNIFIKLIYSATDKSPMGNDTYYMFAALSGVCTGVGRVAIGTTADDLLPSLRKKLRMPFTLPFTILLMVPPWMMTLGLIFVLAIPPAPALIVGYLFISFAYGLITSTVPYAVICFFSFEHVGLGKVYGACLAAVGLGVVTFYRGLFYELLPPPLTPQVPYCLNGKRDCMELFLVICLFLNVIAGIAAVLLHMRFQRRLLAAAHEQILHVKSSQRKDLTALHCARYQGDMKKTVIQAA